MDKLITIKEVSDLLNRSRNNVYVMAREGVLPSVRIGRKVRFNRHEIEEWMANRARHLTVAQLADLLQVSTSHIYRAIANNTITYAMRFRREFLFDQIEIEAWIASGGTITPRKSASI